MVRAGLCPPHAPLLASHVTFVDNNDDKEKHDAAEGDKTWERIFGGTFPDGDVGLAGARWPEAALGLRLWDSR